MRHGGATGVRNGTSHALSEDMEIKRRPAQNGETPGAPCSYWQRQEFRHINDHGFGASPYDFMTTEQAEAHQTARDTEDANDPPCGSCRFCKEVADLTCRLREVR